MANKLTTPVNIPVDVIRPFEGHPYNVLDNEEMNNLIQSIQEQGILSPILLRPIENTNEYEVISGHRRLHAAIKARMKEVPAFIYAISRDEAAVMLVDSNLHREKILPSEKAFAYKMKLDALKSQGKRNDLTSRQVVGRLESADLVSDTESGRQVQRYIRLTNLIPELLDLIDEGEIAFMVGVELSYLDDQTQYDLLRVIEEQDCTPSYSQAWHMHKDFNAGVLTTENIENMLSSEKPNQKERINIPADKLRKYFPKNYTCTQIENEIIKMCETRYRRRADRDSR